MPSNLLPSGLTLDQGSSSATRGRRLLTTKSFRPGDTIAIFGDTITKKTLAIVDSPSLSKACSYCLTLHNPGHPEDPHNPAPGERAANLRACVGCRAAHYCSQTCQKADWALAHKVECKAFRRVVAEDGGNRQPWIPTPIRAIIHVLARPALLEAVTVEYDLQDHVDQFRSRQGGSRPNSPVTTTWDGLDMQARLAAKYMGLSPEQCALALSVACKLQVNSFSRLDSDFGQSGLFLDPGLAMVNHSCVPNAFVQFIGRAAVLKAYRAIGKDEEVEISYVEPDMPRSLRQDALMERYHFSCSCVRCREDLDVYHICKRYPHPELNLLSLISDINTFRNPPVSLTASSDRATRQLSTKFYNEFSEPPKAPDLDENMRQLRKRWGACAPLRKAEVYAIEPLGQVLADISSCFTQQGQYEYSLAIACFLAINSEPYKNPMPFAPQRVKGIYAIAKLLSNTAPMQAEPGVKRTPTAARIHTALGNMDQITMCQVLCALVLKYGPVAHSDTWQLCREAKEMLEDIMSLPGREQESALATAFFRNTQGPEERLFFESIILKSIRELAGFALEVVDAEC